MPTPSNPLALHWSRAPPVYVARGLAAPLIIDGNLNKPEWRSAPWSVPFDEIRGPADAPAGSRPPPGCRTRVKMLYDAEYLYVAALLEYDESLPIVATFTERNSPIFHQDSDFEVRQTNTQTPDSWRLESLKCSHSPATGVCRRGRLVPQLQGARAQRAKHRLEPVVGPALR